MTQEFSALKALSAKVGSDPLLVQAAGGNTSLKQDGVMWIKASGTWLRDAATKDIFVPLDLLRLISALKKDDPACESCTSFVREDLNPAGLRPSIETSLHGLMPQRAVVHVHCVNTIAYAIQYNAAALLAQRLAPFNWSYVPYDRPGLMLSRAIKQAMRPGSDVLILENHGLVVAADTVAEAHFLLTRVIDALQLTQRDLPQPDLRSLWQLAVGTDYNLPHDVNCHAIAMDPWAQPLACNSVYYPDHVVFLGTHIPTDLNGSAPAVVVPGIGTLVHKNAKPSVEPMLRCIGEVFRRLPHNARLNALTPNHIDQLLNWDAEKYRQSLKQQ